MNATPAIQIISSSNSLDVSLGQKCKVIGQFDSTEGLKMAENEKPDIIFLDYEIEQENTDLYIKTLLIESPDSKVILLGKNLSDQTVLNCLIDGCFGYIDWENVDNCLDKAIQFVGVGEAWVSRRLVGLLLEKIRD